MAVVKVPTQRSRLLGLYIQAKAACWIAIGIALFWGFMVAGEMTIRDGFQAFAYFLLLFLVPGVLLWVLGVTVRLRFPTSWWFAVGYLVCILVAKAIIGTTELPEEAWFWVSNRLPNFYLLGLRAFAVLTTAVLAADVAALAAFISLPGRACYGVGKIDRKTLEDLGEGTFW
jgi:hypothetical protein